MRAWTLRTRDEISAIIAPWCAARTLPEVRTAFDAHGVCWGPYQTFRRGTAEELSVTRWAATVSSTAARSASASPAGMCSTPAGRGCSEGFPTPPRLWSDHSGQAT